MRFMFNFIIFYVIISTRILRLVKNSKALIAFLITLEYTILSAYILIFIIFKERFLLFNIIFIVISVIERAIGISLLISMARSFGRDFLLSYPYFSYVYLNINIIITVFN